MSALSFAARLPLASVGATGRFRDYGVGADVAECRGVTLVEGLQGGPLAIGTTMDAGDRGWILVTDIDSGRTNQHSYPPGVPNSPPYASLVSAAGRLYTCAGPTLLEFDLTSREWLFSGVPAPSEACYCSGAFAEAPDGTIYAGSHPHCHIISYDPRAQRMRDFGPMDPEEQYIETVAVDSAGWVYSGIGTARWNIVALDPATGERRQMVPEGGRELGSAWVHLAADGRVYGRAGETWYRMLAGDCEPVGEAEVLPPAPVGTFGYGFEGRTTLGDGRRLAEYNVVERFITIEGPDPGQTQRIELDYRSGGAIITSLAAGPPGRIYASTCHPMNFVVYDPAEDLLRDWGHLRRMGGGNWCAMAAQGPYIIAPSYAMGWVWLYDTRRPWNGETGDEPNPRVIAQFSPDITRPRVALAHPDGRHVIVGGFMEYGMRGGGLGIIDTGCGGSTLLRHTDVIPDQCTIALRAMPNGDLVGGTSVETPGGGHPTETEGVLYRMDWTTRQVTYRTVPVPGAREVVGLEVAADGCIYGVSSTSVLFTFDSRRGEIARAEDLSRYGHPVRPALQIGPDGTLWALFAGGIVRVYGRRLQYEAIEPPSPVTAGMGLLDGRLFYASGARVWSAWLA